MAAVIPETARTTPQSTVAIRSSLQAVFEPEGADAVEDSAIPCEVLAAFLPPRPCVQVAADHEVLV
jgi:hypothetical protein